MSSGFVLRSKINQKLVLEVTGSNANPGTLIQLYYYNGTNAQKWTFTDDGYIQSNLKTSGGLELVLDVQGGNKNRGTKLQVWTKSGSDAQKWSLNAQGSLISKLNGFAIDAPNATAGANPQTWESNGTDPQVFIPGCNSPSYFFLQNNRNGLVLGVQDINASQGTQAKLYTKNRVNSFPKEQLWKFTEDGYLQSALSDNLVLDVCGGNRNNGATVQLYFKNGTDAQRWTFQADVTGGILRSGLGNKVLEGWHGLSTPGSIVDLYDFNMTLTQKWTMVSLPCSKGALILKDVIIPAGKAAGDKMIIQADETTFFSVVIPAGSVAGGSLQVVTGSDMSSLPNVVLNGTVQSGSPYAVGYILDKIVDKAADSVFTRVTKATIAKSVTKEGFAIFEEVAVQSVTKDACLSLKAGFGVAEKLVTKYGLDAVEKSASKSVGSFLVKHTVEGPFFEVGIAASLGALAATEIAGALGAGKVVTDLADCAGGALGGAAMGAIIGGPAGALVGAAVGVTFELMSVGVAELINLIPPLSWCSEQSYDSLTIINSTSYDWIRTATHSYQMNFWDECFPVFVPAGTTVVCPVLATIGSSFSTHVNTDDGGDHTYVIQDGSNSSFRFHYQYPGKFTVIFEKMQTLQNEIGSTFVITKAKVTPSYKSNLFVLKGSVGSYQAFSDVSKSFVNIKAYSNPDYVLDVTGGSVVGAKVQLYNKNNTPAQTWLFTDDGYIQSAFKTSDGSDLVLDILYCNRAPGATLQLCTKNGFSCQKWTFNANGSLTSKLNGFAVDAPNGRIGAGVLLQTFPPSGSISQMWKISTAVVVQSFVNIVAYNNPNYVLDVTGGSFVGAKVQLYTKNNTPAQQWLFTDDGYIQSAFKTSDGSDLVLDILYCNPAAGAKLQVCTKNGVSGQKWTLNANGSLTSKLNGFAVDVPNGQIAAGVLLQTYPPNGSTAQMWKITNA